MNRRFIVYGIFSLCLIAFLLPACEKAPGEGGSASVVGKLFLKDLDSDGVLKEEYFVPDEKVFIIYGDNSIYDDDTRTHFDGSFQFKYLYKGEYTVFAYSKCNTCESGIGPIMKTFEITEKGQIYDLDTLIIFD